MYVSIVVLHNTKTTSHRFPKLCLKKYYHIPEEGFALFLEAVPSQYHAPLLPLWEDHIPVEKKPHRLKLWQWNI